MEQERKSAKAFQTGQRYAMRIEASRQQAKRRADEILAAAEQSLARQRERDEKRCEAEQRHAKQPPEKLSRTSCADWRTGTCSAYLQNRPGTPLPKL